MLKYLFLCLGFGFSFYTHQSLADCEINQVDEWSHIKKVIDGDTVVLSDGRKVRIIGINTPEIGRDGEASEAFAVQSLQALKSFFSPAAEIGLSYGKDRKDKYRRLLAHISLPEGRNAASELLRQGLAVSIVVPPNDRFLSCYRKLEQQARKGQHGLWQLPENQLIPAQKLSSKATGYRFVSGSVGQYKSSKKSIYLQLHKNLAIRIAKRDLKYFKSLELKQLKGARVIVRGWVSTYKGQQSIHIRHADNISVVKQ